MKDLFAASSTLASMCAMTYKTALYATCLRLDWQMQLPDMCRLLSPHMSVSGSCLWNGYATAVCK